MKLCKLTTMAIAAGLALGALADAVWVWHPGDYALWHGNRVQARRLERGGRLAPFWPQYAPHTCVTFGMWVELRQAETVEVYADGEMALSVSQGYKDTYNTAMAATNRIALPAGKTWISARVQNDRRPPAFFMRGPTVQSNSGTVVAESTGTGVQLPAECEARFNAPDKTPWTWTPATRPVAPVATRRVKDRQILSDFGQETYGFARVDGVRGSGHAKVIYAESEPEALDEVDGHVDSWEIVNMSAGSWRSDVPHGFRYLHVIPLDGDLQVGSVSMDFEESPAKPARGSFRCSDERLNRIWDVSAHTLALTSREVFIEGVKRDHWVWSGDAVQSFLMNYYLAADEDLVKRSLWTLRGGDPVYRHVNSIMDYTFYWFIAVRDYWLYSGDRTFLRQIYPPMESLMAWVCGRLDANGRPCDRPGDWMFIDWAPKALPNRGGVCAFEQMLFVRALESLADVAREVGKNDAAKGYADRAARLRDEIVPLWWDDAKGGLLHLLRSDGTRHPMVTRYANMFGLFYGYFDDARRDRVVRDVLLNDSVMKIQTPYMRFYELEALARIGKRAHVLDEIRSYWGGMLDLGATAFWELYNPAEKGDRHYAMYGRPYGKSLCHAWGASPIYLLGRYYLGVEPTKPGFAEYAVAPDAAGLAWMEGVVPTPRGDVRVSVRDGKVRVVGNGGRGTLRWKGRELAIAPSATVEAE